MTSMYIGPYYGEGKLLGSFLIPVHHGLLILRDSESRSTHDDWDPSRPGVHVENDSIYVPVVPAIEDSISFAIFLGRVGSPDMHVVYSGPVELESGRLVVHDANEDIYVVFHVDADVNNVQISVDDLGLPRTVEFDILE